MSEPTRSASGDVIVNGEVVNAVIAQFDAKGVRQLSSPVVKSGNPHNPASHLKDRGLRVSCADSLSREIDVRFGIDVPLVNNAVKAVPFKHRPL
jgi:hypothetical protein